MAALAAASEILLSMAELPYQKTMNYWNLLQKLEASIDKNNPAVYAAAGGYARRGAAAAVKQYCRFFCGKRGNCLCLGYGW
jgi:hypothetical protein